jgi:hypothetical protein
VRSLINSFAEYLPVAVGMFFGALAHFGEYIERHGWPSMRAILGFLMQQGLVALAAVFVIRQMGIKEADYQAFMCAIFAVSSNEIIRWARSKQRSVTSMVLGPTLPADAEPSVTDNKTL